MVKSKEVTLKMSSSYRKSWQRCMRGWPRWKTKTWRVSPFSKKRTESSSASLKKPLLSKIRELTKRLAEW